MVHFPARHVRLQEGIQPITQPGNDCHIAIEAMDIDIVDIPIENGDFPKLC